MMSALQVLWRAPGCGAWAEMVQASAPAAVAAGAVGAWRCAGLGRTTCHRHPATATAGTASPWFTLDLELSPEEVS